MELENFLTIFRNTFEQEPAVVTRAPGRVNLIGEHTDYNQGFVLPIAINREVWCALAHRRDAQIVMQSIGRKRMASQPLANIHLQKSWADYPLGVIREVQAKTQALHGMNVMFQSDIPPGAGLSSSAALEVATAQALDAVFSLGLSEKEKAEAAHRAENQFVGVPCGIMDQFVSAAAKKNHALFLDCRTLEHAHCPFSLPGYSVMIIDSRKPRRLAASKYAERLQECATAVERLQPVYPGTASLRDLSPEQLEASQARLALPPPLWSRARHVVTENFRVQASVEALHRQDFMALGELMLDSHLSLKNDYEVSCPELDFLVDITTLHAGCLGARLTGAGFGGCTLNLIETNAAREIQETVVAKYLERFGLQPQFYLSRAEDGASLLWS